MRKTVEIKFKPEGKTYVFDSGAFVLKTGDYVIVETEQGFGMGVVSAPPVQANMEHVKTPLKKVHRKAVDTDFKQLEENRELESRGLEFCGKQIDELGLEMNLFSVECTFDSRKLTFFYTADGRVDFRELVKRLVKHFRIKIEMRQVGIRNQAKITGGIGRCGREVCCAAFMKKFDPISIRMAKNQGLSLNPTKISGLCGRLMCCLAFEERSYNMLKKSMPKIGSFVETQMGTGKVLDMNPVARRLTIQRQDNSRVEVTLDELISGRKERPDAAGQDEANGDTPDAADAAIVVDGHRDHTDKDK
ncbi:MAG: regulatory iron-sulfur-containing complex subunit RicT [Thermodesulfobacteriota bacterium]|nr:regulatory iron-sulfur-containing complex subunit RicT [Thermodesulfobacteriota bacterium]